MTALNKQALREAANAANIASWGKWESYKPHKGARGYEVKVGAKAVAQHCLKVDSAFIAAANPSTVLALLDELEHYKSREDRVTRLVLDNSTSWDELYKKLEAAEKRIAELESRTVKLPDDAEHDIMAPVAAYLSEKFKWDGGAARWDGRKEYDVLADRVKYALRMVIRSAAGIGVRGE